MGSTTKTAPVEAAAPSESNGLAAVKDVLLSASEILGADDIVTELVEIPEWKGKVIVRGLTGAERDGFEESLLERRGKNREVRLANLRAKLCALTMVDGNGKRLFSDAQVEALGKKSASALQRVFAVAQRLSGLSDEDVEELAGELGKGGSASSGSV
jgi:hypothetical protein